MQLPPSARLGPFEILAPVGAGGMGEVYRARDTRLDRQVAIKILSRDFSGNAAVRERFEREARAVSQLAHPHICTLFDVGRDNGTDYLVMEFLEGEPLSKRLERGPLPLREVLEYGTQIAGALDKAHRQGIVHRDLKPGNVMLTRSGAKLLDFGLAKLSPKHAQPLGTLTNVPTQEKHLTEEGTILGTFQYMAPEQLEGVEADARTDIFALGALLYEMATGRRAFEGKTRTSLIAAIVSLEPPPISQVQPLTPPALEHVVSKCLAKDPDDRWQSAHDVAAELKWIAESGSQPAATPAPLSIRRRTRERILWIAALVAATVAAAVLTTVRRPAPPISYRFQVDTLGLGHSYGAVPRISPDGTMVIYAAEDADGRTHLLLRRLDQAEPRAVEGSTGLGSAMGFSRDSKQLAFTAGGQLKRVSVAGGTPQIVANASGRGLAFGDGFILLGSTTGGIRRVSLSDGKVEVITRPDGKQARGHVLPKLLPDGEHFLFTTFGPHREGPDHHDLYVASVKTGASRLLGDFPSGVDYAAGYLFYVRDGVGMARPFDAKKQEFTGEPVTVVEGVRVHAVIGSISLSAAEDGTVVSQRLSQPHRLLVINDRGEVLRTIAAQERYDSPGHVTADGTSLVTARVDPKTGTSDIYFYGIDRPTVTRGTFEVTTDFYPVISPDGTRLYFSSDRNGVPDIFERTLDGSEAAKLVVEEAGDESALDISPIEPRLLLYRSTVQGRGDLKLLPLAGGKPYPVVTTPGTDRDGRFSPDGRSISYVSDVSGREEVYVKSLSSKDPAVQVSTSGGWSARWSRDGRRLFFMSGDQRSLMAASRAGDRFAEPRVLWTRERKIPTIEPLPDGKRFVVTELDDVAGTAPINVFVRWTATVPRAR